MPARSVCLVTLSLSEAGPGRFGGQVSVTDIYHTIPPYRISFMQNLRGMRRLSFLPRDLALSGVFVPRLESGRRDDLPLPHTFAGSGRNPRFARRHGRLKLLLDVP